MRLAVGEPEAIWLDPNAPRQWSRSLLGEARAASYKRLVEPLDPAIGRLAAALLLGRRDGVDPAVSDAFARTGTLHLLAISGLHMQVLAGGVWALGSLLGMSRRKAASLAMASVLYALLVGLEALRWSAPW